MEENQTPLIPEIVENTDIVDIDKSQKPQKDIPLTKIVELRRKGLSLQQIADICKCSKQNIHMRLRDCDEFEDFAKDPATHYEALLYRIYKSIDDNDIKRTPMAQRVVTIGILEDKKRLIRNQSTQNIDVFELAMSLKDIEKQENELLKDIRLVLKADIEEPQ